MDDDGVPLLYLTLSAIDSDEIIVGCFRIGVGCGCCCRVDAVEDSTINWGGDPASNGSSLLPTMLNCTCGGVSNCTLGGASICTLGERAWSGNLFPGQSDW
jgi:hypothetical protein